MREDTYWRSKTDHHEMSFKIESDSAHLQLAENVENKMRNA